jgi:hypothetical protein
MRNIFPVSKAQYILVRAKVQSTVSSRHYKMVEVGAKVTYNGQILFILELVSESMSISARLSYFEVVVETMHKVSSLRLGLSQHRSDATEFIVAVPASLYTPIACSYPDMMSELFAQFALEQLGILNQKHDGEFCWIYVSEVASLIGQVKYRGGYFYRYLGRLSDVLIGYVSKPKALMVEMIYSSTGADLIAVDCFDGETRPYTERIEDMNRVIDVVRNAMIKDGVCCNDLTRYTLRATQGKILNGTRSICDSMKYLREHQDGYILYIADMRPLKVKTADMATVDLEYSYSTLDGVIVHNWMYASKLTPMNPLVAHPYLERDRRYVVEVRVCDGTIVRLRPDRARGNPPDVVDSIVRIYERDRKYSSLDIWSGENVRFVIIVNKAFKSFIYSRYIPRGACLIDMGSGNGGDSDIWRKMEYNVLAIEKVHERIKVLRSRTKDNLKVSVRTRDMIDIIPLLKSSLIRYRYVTFMRSLSHLGAESIVKLLSALREYGITKIIILTMVRDFSRNVHVIDRRKQEFSVQLLENGSVSQVSYRTDGKSVTYKDNCYSVEEWSHMSSKSGYSCTYVRQSDVVRSVLGLEDSPIAEVCSMDVVFVLESIS